MDPENDPLVRESKKIGAALWRTIEKSRPSTSGVALMALVKTLVEVVMSFPPEHREIAAQWAAQVVRDTIASAAHWYPEEFGKQPPPN